MSRDLLDDVQSVWGGEDQALPCSILLSRLKVLDGRRYAGWDAMMFGRAMRSAGAPTKTIRYAGAVVRGVALESLSGALLVHDEVVYFAERDGYLKIGTTRNLPARVADLDRGSSAIPGMRIEPVTVRAVMPGGRAVEQAIHALFASWRFDGEWFLFDGPLVDFVAAVARAASREAS